MHAQSASELTRRQAFRIQFPVNVADVIADSADNSATLDSITTLFKELGSDPSLTLEKAEVSGAASPDGRLRPNVRLARQRRDSLANYLYRNCNVPAGSLTLKDYYVPWHEFRTLVAEHDIPDSRHIIELSLEGSDTDSSDVSRRMLAIKEFAGGTVWHALRREILPRLRFAMLDVTTRRTIVEPAPVEVEVVETEPAEIVPEADVVATDTIEYTIPADTVADGCGRHWTLSSNLAGLALAIVNLTPEYAFACHWSAALSLYYSAWDYGRVDRKFRTFIFRPEMRWWPRSTREGFYAQAHLAMVAYNFALPSWTYRIQDVDGKNPALGGGVGIGWRKAIGSKGWALEGALGVGCYRLKYNKFENRDNGPLVTTVRKTFFGIDNVAVSVVYNFKSTKR